MLVGLRRAGTESRAQGDHSAHVRTEQSCVIHYLLTFITTSIPFCASIRGANSDTRYASNLYRAFVANIATAGVWSTLNVSIERMVVPVLLTICLFDEIWNKVCLMSVMESRDGEFKLVRNLWKDQHCNLNVVSNL